VFKRELQSSSFTRAFQIDPVLPVPHRAAQPQDPRHDPHLETMSFATAVKPAHQAIPSPVINTAARATSASMNTSRRRGQAYQRLTRTMVSSNATYLYAFIVSLSHSLDVTRIAPLTVSPLLFVSRTLLTPPHPGCIYIARFTPSSKLHTPNHSTCSLRARRAG
jgi:hypothetical protein